MPLEKSIIKADTAPASTFEYKPRELNIEISEVARSYVDRDSFKSPDFKISDLVAQQAGISRLESDAYQDKINMQVLERLKEVQEKAYEQGYELGLIEGNEKAFAENQAALLERLKTMEGQLKIMENLKQNLLVESEDALIQLVYHVARRIGLRDLEENREGVLEILKNVVTEMQSDERVTVRMANDDLVFIEGLQEKSATRIEGLERVKFVLDETVKPGGCMIETEYGNVDATVEERVDRVWQTLKSRIPRRAQAPPEG